MQIHLFDTTLRDGTQSEGLSLSVEDKLKISRVLDGFGIHFIEGGYPGSNPKDIEFFRRARELKLKNAKLTAFGSTRKANGAAASDPNMQALVEAQTPVVCIFGKSWLLHVTKVLGATPEEGLAMISDSVAYLSLDGLTGAVPDGRTRYCTSCYTGVYPVAFPRDETTYLQLALKLNGEAAAGSRPMALTELETDPVAS